MHKNLRDSNVRAKTHLIMSTVSSIYDFPQLVTQRPLHIEQFSFMSIDEYKPYETLSSFKRLFVVCIETLS